MAIYSFQCKIVSRAGKINNAVSHAAYINRQDLHNDRDGSTWKYAKKHDDIYHSDVLLPEGADLKFKDASYLWNEVEKKENRSNSRLARSFIIALPNELKHEQNKELLEDFITEHFTKHGMIANYAIHIDNPENIHVHIMTTTRELAVNGKEFAKKNVIGRTWNNDEMLEQWRKGWSDIANKHLAKYDHQTRIDHRTLEAQLEDAIDKFEADPSAENYKRVVELDRPATKYVSRRDFNDDVKKQRIDVKQEHDKKVDEEYQSFKTILNTKEPIIVDLKKPENKKEESKPVEIVKVRRPRNKVIFPSPDTTPKNNGIKSPLAHKPASLYAGMSANSENKMLEVHKAKKNDTPGKQLSKMAGALMMAFVNRIQDIFAGKFEKKAKEESKKEDGVIVDPVTKRMISTAKWEKMTEHANNYNSTENNKALFEREKKIREQSEPKPRPRPEPKSEPEQYKKYKYTPH